MGWGMFSVGQLDSWTVGQLDKNKSIIYYSLFIIHYFRFMHELSIALSIVESAEEAARNNGASLISKVEVEIGTMAGVETDALLFAWDSVIQNTMAQNAPLIIHSIQAMANCTECGKDFPIDNYFTECPQCKSFRYQVTRGRELKVSSLTIDS